MPCSGKKGSQSLLALALKAAFSGPGRQEQAGRQLTEWKITHRSGAPGFLCHRGPGEAPGSNLLSLWPFGPAAPAELSCRLSSQSQPFPLLEFMQSFSHSPSNGCRVVLLSAPLLSLWVLSAESSAGLKGFCCTLASGLVGLPACPWVWFAHQGVLFSCLLWGG